MNEVAAQLARDNGVTVIVADIEQPGAIEQIERKFDAIILMDVLEHLRYPAEVLRRLQGALNSQGRILITGPNIANWGVRKDLFFGKWKYVDAGILDRTHLHFYTGQGWRELVEEAGYQVTVFGPADGLVPLVHWLGKLSPLKNLVPRLHRLGVKRLPGLFAITYFIEAQPAQLAQPDDIKV
jgi:SAM-dependent methyltransferase